MRISTLGYVGKQGVKNIGRNKMFSIASIATMSACIFLFGLFFSIVLNLQHFVKTAEEGVAITVFFDEDATESQIEEIGKELRSRDDVLKVEYVSEDDAWNSFKESTLETIRNWQMDLRMTIRLQAPAVMRFI